MILGEIMNKIKYYIGRLFNLSFKEFFKTIKIVSERSGKNKIIIFFDIIICSLKYQSGYVDYRIFYFEELSSKQRKTFVTRGINNSYIKAMNDPKYFDSFNNKVKFNKIFSKYIGRDYVYLDNNYEEFLSFVKKHKTILVKPIDLQCGKNIEKIIINKSINLKKLYDQLNSNKQLLVEQYIIQSKEMNKLFPNSVNSLRIVAGYKNGKSKILFRAIRIGNGKNVVDNFNHGGMYSVISEQGIITNPAIDRQGNIYEKHPVTKTPISGFKIPYFKEALKMIETVSKKIPEVGLVGWDIAITDNGPILIEGNQYPGYDIYQSKIHLNDDKTGVRPIFDEFIFKKK